MPSLCRCRSGDCRFWLLLYLKPTWRLVSRLRMTSKSNMIRTLPDGGQHWSGDCPPGVLQDHGGPQPRHREADIEVFHVIDIIYYVSFANIFSALLPTCKALLESPRHQDVCIQNGVKVLSFKARFYTCTCRMVLCNRTHWIGFKDLATEINMTVVSSSYFVPFIFRCDLLFEVSNQFSVNCWARVMLWLLFTRSLQKGPLHRIMIAGMVECQQFNHDVAGFSTVVVIIIITSSRVFESGRVH